MPKKLKRANGEGSVYRQGGKWRGAITIGIDQETGRPRRIYLSGRTQKEVLDKLDRIQSSRREGIFLNPARVTVGQWMDTWLDTYARARVRPSTAGSYEYLIRRHIRPALGKIALRDLRPEQIQAVYADRLAAGLSARTVNLIHVTLHAALRQAVKNGLLARNVTESTSPPRQEKKEIRVLTKKEQDRFLAAIGKNRLGPAFLLALATGLRRGELLALRRQDVDLDAGIVRVTRGLVEVRTPAPADEPDKTIRVSLAFQEVKTKRGRRVVPIPADVLPALRAHLDKMDEEKAFLGPRYRDHGLLFCTEYGTPIHPRSFSRSFARFVRAAGLEGVSPHTLRHSFATRLLEADEHPKVVQELLGHSSIGLTMDTYSHVSMELKRRAAEKMNAALSRGRTAGGGGTMETAKPGE